MLARFCYADVETARMSGLKAHWRGVVEDDAGDLAHGWLLQDATRGRALSLLVFHDPATDRVVGAREPELTPKGDPCLPLAAPEVLLLQVSAALEPREASPVGAVRVLEATAIPGDLAALVANWLRLGDDHYLSQPGFAGTLLCTDSGTGVMRSVTLWRDERSMLAQESEHLDRTVGSMRPFFTADPVRTRWSVRLGAGGPR